MGKNNIQNNNEIMIIVDECKKTIDTTSIWRILSKKILGVWKISEIDEYFTELAENMLLII